jgi:EmrB/QacA subfamily drug resistance transporter
LNTVVRTPCDEAVARSTLAAAPCPPGAEPWILAATILASSLVFIDGTVVNVALPQLQLAFGATIFQSQWVVESYALLLSTLLLLGGVAGDRYGRRRVFSIGVVVFAMGSAWCAAARSIDELIVARAFQGIGGALLVPGSLAILGASFPQERRGKAIGIWSGYTAIASALGPVLGGWLIDHLSWRWAFLVNIPFALAVLAITHWRVAESRDPAAPHLDWPGAALATVGLGALVFGLIESAQRGWTDPQVASAFVLSAFALGGFALLESRLAAPMLPPHLFRSRDFTGANLLTLLLYAALGGGLFFFPLDLIQVHGYSATAAGAAFLPVVLIMFLLSGWAGGLVDRYGARLPLVVGPCIAAAGFALFAVPGVGGSYWTTFFPAIVVLGLGMAVCVAPLTTTVLNAVDTSLAGTASGINNAVSRIAGLLAIALFGIVMNHVFNAHLQRRLEALAVPSDVLQAIAAERAKLGAMEIPRALDPPLRAALQDAVAECFIAGFRQVMLISALLALASAAIAWLMIDGKARRAKAAADGIDAQSER